MTEPIVGVHTAHEREPVPPGRLWYGVFAAPAAWIAQGAFGWLAGSRICTSMTVGAVRTTVALLSIGMLVIAISGLVVAHGNWKRSSDAPHPTAVSGWDRVEFMSAAGVLLGVMFIIAIVWAGLGSALLDRCGGMR
jgi:hypothetical protein